MGFSLPSVEFPFLFLNLHENEILSITSYDYGASLNLVSEPFKRGRMKVKLCKTREQMHSQREKYS